MSQDECPPCGSSPCREATLLSSHKSKRQELVQRASEREKEKVGQMANKDQLGRNAKLRQNSITGGGRPPSRRRRAVLRSGERPQVGWHSLPPGRALRPARKFHEPAAPTFSCASGCAQRSRRAMNSWRASNGFARGARSSQRLSLHVAFRRFLGLPFSLSTDHFCLSSFFCFFFVPVAENEMAFGSSVRVLRSSL